MITIPTRIKKTVGRGQSLFRAINLVQEHYAVGHINIVETGTTRGRLGGGPLGDGWATILWAWYADNYNSMVYTIDIDKCCIEECKELTKDYNNIKYKCMNSLDFFKDQDMTIHLLYLDSADDPQLMMDEFLAAERLLDKDAFILLDDVGPDFVRGKGTILGPHLMAHPDYELLYHDVGYTVNQALFRRINA